VIVVHLTWANH